MQLKIRNLRYKLKLFLKTKGVLIFFNQNIYKFERGE